MKQYITVLILITMVLLWSCAAPTIPPVRVKLEPGDELFSKAETMFQVKAYDKALDVYKTYLSQFHNGRHAPASMLRIGTIYMIQGNTAGSRKTYIDMIAEYPDSPLVPDARIEILATFYHEGNYAEVIERSAPLLKRTASRIHLFKIYTLLGDAYVAINSQPDGVFAYAMAYRQSKEPEQKDIFLKLKAAIEQLTSTDIISLLGRLEDKLPRSYLIYQLGINNAGEDEYGNAVKALSDFVEEFPEHEYFSQAVSLLEELKKESTYSHHTIGCLLPLTGRYKIFGERTLKGIELALAQFSSQHETPYLKIIIKDTESDPVRAELAVKELSEARVAAIIGPIITAESVVREAQVKKIPIITLIQKDNISESGDYIFRNFLTPKMQAETIVSYAIETLGLKKFAILYPEENYGRTFMNIFWDEVIKYGGKIVGIESYNVNITDFSSPIKKLIGLYYEVPEDLKDNDPRFVHLDKSMVPFDPLLPEFIKELTGPFDATPENPEIPIITFFEEDTVPEEKLEPFVDFDAIFIPDAPKQAGLIIPQLAFFDIENIYLFGTNLWHSDTLIEMAKEYVQGAVITAGFFAESTSKHVRDFVRIFEEIYEESPGFIEAISYDTAMILFQTVSRPEVRFRQTLKDELLKLRNFPGVTGLTSFDSTGDVLKQLYLLRIKRSKFEEVKYVETYE